MFIMLGIFDPSRVIHMNMEIALLLVRTDFIYYTSMW